MNRFVIAEPSKCIGCRTCEVACVLAHPMIDGGLQNLSPENFKPRLKVVKSATVTAPVQCRQCENAPCVNSCPTEALVYSNGTVQLIAGRCIGCQTCVVACPFGAMEMVDVLVKQSELGSLAARRTVSQAHKCDMCIDRAEGPACIPVCPTNALILIEPSSLESVSEQRRQQALASMEAAESR
ncbi:MAG: 4Fe-4S dicluster domain-containing protein [Oxalobacter sp.]|nr:MAG: 4Fe-4S dicluster domain-containing protein [Oxalobacter sp.]